MKSKQNIFLSNIHFLVDHLGQNQKSNLKEFMASVERNLILATLTKTEGSQIKASELLGVKNTTLNEKIKKYNICFQKRAI